MSPDQPTPSGKPLMRRLLYLGSGLLACATLFDLAREGLSGGSWHATAVLGQAYGLVLAAYAALRESEKWADPQDQRSYGGHWFLLAWCGLPVLCRAGAGSSWAHSPASIWRCGWPTYSALG